MSIKWHRTLGRRALVVLHDLLIVGVVVAIVGLFGVMLVSSYFPKSKHVAAVPVSQPKTKTNVLPATQPAGFGIAFGDTLRGLSAADLTAQLNDTAQIGFTWIRMDIDWWAVQPNSASQYDWSQYDQVIDAANAAHLKVLATLTRTPPWARLATCRSNESCAPAGVTNYANFTKAVVQRYAPKGVKTWEIWNEPNLTSFWAPKPSAASYTLLLKAAYAQIKAADPQAEVLSGGISSLDDNPNSVEQITFLKGMYANGAKSYFDALGYHAYSYPSMPLTVRSWSGWSKINDLSPSLRSIMIANGDTNKLIWITEFGAPTEGPGGEATTYGYIEGQDPYHVSESMQAASAADAVKYVQESSWMAAMFWYSYKDLGTAQDDNENFFGIRRRDGSPKPAYSTFQQVLPRP